MLWCQVMETKMKWISHHHWPVLGPLFPPGVTLVIGVLYFCIGRQNQPIQIHWCSVKSVDNPYSIHTNVDPQCKKVVPWKPRSSSLAFKISCEKWPELVWMRPSLIMHNFSTVLWIGPSLKMHNFSTVFWSLSFVWMTPVFFRPCMVGDNRRLIENVMFQISDKTITLWYNQLGNVLQSRVFFHVFQKHLIIWLSAQATIKDLGKFIVDTVPCFVTVVEEFFDITNGLSVLICTIQRLSTCGRSGMLVKCRKWVRFVLRTISITVGMTSDYVQTLKCIARLCFYFVFLLYNLDFNLLWSIILMSSF